MELNEAGQLLLPLVGINRRKLHTIKDSIEAIGIVDNTLAIRTSYEIEIDCVPVKGTKYIYLIQPKPEYNKDFNKLLIGNYYGIKASTKSYILSNLSKNKDMWRDIFNNTEKAIKDRLTSILGKNRENLEDILDDLYHNITKDKRSISKFQAYKPLNQLNLDINDNKNQLTIRFGDSNS